MIRKGELSRVLVGVAECHVNAADQGEYDVTRHEWGG